MEKNTQQNLPSIDRNLINRQSGTGSGASNYSKSKSKSDKNIVVEKLYFVEDKIVDLQQVFSVESKVGQYAFGMNVGNPVILNMCGNQERKSMIGEVKWIGMINNEKCVGLDMEKECIYGKDGIIDAYNRFDCKPGHGLVTTLENVELYRHRNQLKTFANGLVDPNQYIKSDEKFSCSAKQFKMNENVFVKLFDADIWLKGEIRWLGEMNDEQVAVVELEENHENGTNGKFWRQQLFTCHKNRAVATRCNNINKCIYFMYLSYFKIIISIYIDYLSNILQFPDWLHSCCEIKYLNLIVLAHSCCKYVLYMQLLSFLPPGMLRLEHIKQSLVCL